MKYIMYMICPYKVSFTASNVQTVHMLHVYKILPCINILNIDFYLTIYKKCEKSYLGLYCLSLWHSLPWIIMHCIFKFIRWSYFHLTMANEKLKGSMAPRGPGAEEFHPPYLGPTNEKEILCTPSRRSLRSHPWTTASARESTFSKKALSLYSTRVYSHRKLGAPQKRILSFKCRTNFQRGWCKERKKRS